MYGCVTSQVRLYTARSERAGSLRTRRAGVENVAGDALRACRHSHDRRGPGEEAAHLKGGQKKKLCATPVLARSSGVRIQAATRVVPGRLLSSGCRDTTQCLACSAYGDVRDLLYMQNRGKGLKEAETSATAKTRSTFS